MKKVIISLVAALALLVGVNVTPAGAFVLAPYEHATSWYGTCSVDVTWGQYGSAAYAIMTENPGSVCHFNTAVAVAAVSGGGYAFSSPWCPNWGRLSNPYPANCSYNGLATQAVAIGTAIGGGVFLCYEPTPGNPACATVGFGPWG